MIKQLKNVAENGAFSLEQQAVEIAGFGKLIIEDGAEFTTKTINMAAKNKHVPKNIGHPGVENSTIIIDKNIIANINEKLKNVILEFEEHIFSPDHKTKGILILGKDQASIMDTLYDIIANIHQQGILQEGPNQIKATINGINNVEIRCFVQNKEIRSVNAFLSDFNRIYGNFIDLTKK